MLIPSSLVQLFIGQYLLGNSYAPRTGNTLVDKTSSTGKIRIPGGSVVKNSPANEGDADLIPGSGRSPRERNGNQFCILACKISWTEGLGGLQSTELQKSRT